MELIALKLHLWLKLHNPHIDWCTGQIFLESFVMRTASCLPCLLSPPLNLQVSLHFLLCTMTWLLCLVKTTPCRCHPATQTTAPWTCSLELLFPAAACTVSLYYSYYYLLLDLLLLQWGLLFSLLGRKMELRDHALISAD